MITGGFLAIHSKKDALKYITLLYTVAFGLFIVYTLYFQLNTSSKREKLKSTYLRFYGTPEDTPLNSYSDNRVFLSMFFMPGLLVDKFLFPPNIYIYYTMLFVFGAGAIASTYYAIELNNYEIKNDGNNFFIEKNEKLNIPSSYTYFNNSHGYFLYIRQSYFLSYLIFDTK